jgi:hypothetical protein
VIASKQSRKRLSVRFFCRSPLHRVIACSLGLAIGLLAYLIVTAAFHIASYDIHAHFCDALLFGRHIIVSNAQISPVAGCRRSGRQLSALVLVQRFCVDEWLFGIEETEIRRIVQVQDFWAGWKIRRDVGAFADLGNEASKSVYRWRLTCVLKLQQNFESAIRNIRNKLTTVEYNPRSRCRDLGIGAFLSRIGRLPYFAGLISGESSVQEQSDESAELDGKSGFANLALEFLVETLLFLVVCGLVAVGWCLVGWMHETFAQVLLGFALIVAALPVATLFVLINVGEIRL